ncbi:MAG: c-type cytochrome, methanol metabolism-related [Rhizobiales bacterium]|nr:c-type cytochrome, methanol metabolism-related [Hyphomicrobiales bacterium]
MIGIFWKNLLVAGIVAIMSIPGAVVAGDQVVTEEDGKFFNAESEPTYNIREDGTVDWYTYSGFRRYHSECHVCHGPEGNGSSFAPALTNSLRTLTYSQFIETVASGRERVTADGAISKMPALGDNVNVWCYIDDIYTYLKARADDVLPPGRPTKRADKPASAKAYEKGCIG